ncbi:MAG: hypothetical protein ABIA63_06350, partial [bacterium]
ACGGIALDSKKSIYLGANLKPYGSKMNSFFQDFLNTNSLQECDGMYREMTGSLLKFPAGGGTVLAGGSGNNFESVVNPAYTSKDLLWSKYSYTSQSSKRIGCACESPRHDVDGHHRTFMPDPLTFCIRVYDDNGNEITSFGNYGNMDSRGPGSRISVPEIPFSYPLGVAVSDKAAYINDVYSHRIVRADLAYKESGFADIGDFPVPWVSLRAIKENITSADINFTNPFKPGSLIRLNPAFFGNAEFLVYDIKGQLKRNFNIRNENMDKKTLRWDGRDNLGEQLPNGTYLIRFCSISGNAAYTGKLVLLK